MEEKVKIFIDKYMDSNKAFAEDIQTFNQKLAQNSRKGSEKKSIIALSHRIDINSLIHSFNHEDIEFLLEKEFPKKRFAKLFEKRLKRRLQTNDTKIWFCLQYKNLPENRNVKTYRELRESPKQLVSIDSLQIVSMSQTLKACIGRKYVAKCVPKTPEESENPTKWCIKRILETEFPKNITQTYNELKDQKVYTEKRLILTNIGQKDATNCVNPFQITVFLEIFSEKQLQSLYNGSYLESVVLLQIEKTLEYILLSFDKIHSPVPQLISNFNQYLLQFPENFRELFEDRKVSKYSLPLSLAFIFGDNISISGSFFRLKLGLLLSLLSLNEYPKKNHSSVLVICDDTLMIRRLFEWSSFLSEYRYLLKSLSVPMTGKSREERQSLKWIDAGALQLGADGITIIGSVTNLNDLPNKERMSLFHALETNEVIAKQSQPSEPSLTELELKSTVWAVIEDDYDERHLKQKSNKTQTILWTHVFGMVYIIPKSTDKYIYTRPGIEGTLALEEWQTIFKLMAQIKPQMTERAKKLLQSYYVISRRIRGLYLNHISVQTLISLSKSMAKLSLRLEVTKYDALMAILLYEESLTTRLQERESPLSVNPIFHVLVKDMNHFIGNDSDQMMEQFESQLMEFFAKQTENSKSNPLPEFATQNEE